MSPLPAPSRSQADRLAITTSTAAMVITAAAIPTGIQRRPSQSGHGTRLVSIPVVVSARFMACSLLRRCRLGEGRKAALSVSPKHDHRVMTSRDQCQIYLSVPVEVSSRERDDILSRPQRWERSEAALPVPEKDTQLEGTPG